MNIVIFLSLFFIKVNTSFAITADQLKGTWDRIYSTYIPWTDENQGTFTYYEEKLKFYPDGSVNIYQEPSKDLKGKSLYKLYEKDKETFIVFYTPEQEPESKEIQESQGFFINISNNNKDNTQQITILTTKEYEKNKKSKKKIPGVIYKKIAE